MQVRLAIFGSFYRGAAILKRGLNLAKKYPDKLAVVGVATDDPLSSRVSPHKRVWQYVTDQRERDMVQSLAEENGVQVYQDSIKTDYFYHLFAQEWQPDICFMGTFGQRIPPRLFTLPRLGFYNFHPSTDRAWPSYIGGNPFAEMIRAGEKYCVLSMHHVDKGFDTGKRVAVSKRFPITKDDTVLSLHKKTAEAAADMTECYVRRVVLTP